MTEQSSNLNNVNIHHSILNLDKLQALYTNCDCLTQTKLSELKNFVAKKSPDIIAITEVFPKNSIFSPSHEHYQIKDYDIFLTETDGRGVCIYAKTSLNATSLTFTSEFTEHSWCQINLKQHNK